MKKRFFCLIAVLASAAFAESWTGPLVDTSCMTEQRSVKACQPTNSTTHYSVVANDQVYELDQNGNAKAAAILKTSADREANPNGKTALIVVNVTGTKDGNTIRVDSLAIQPQ